VTGQIFAAGAFAFGWPRGRTNVGKLWRGHRDMEERIWEQKKRYSLFELRELNATKRDRGVPYRYKLVGSLTVRSPAWKPTCRNIGAVPRRWNCARAEQLKFVNAVQALNT